MTSPIFKIFMIFLFVGAATTGCKKEEVATTAPPFVPVDPEVPTPGVVDQAGGFNIKVNPPEGANYYIHLKDDFDSPCSVSATATSLADKDITCTVEVEELEGKFHGIDMVLNVPTSMCKYVSHLPFYYFGETYGTAPATANINILPDGTLDPTSNVGAGGSLTAAGELRCDYDYSADGGPNCCIGDTNIVRRTDFGTPEQVSTPETKTWGGQPGNCVAGPGSAAKRNKVDNMPIPTIYYSTTGFSQSFPVAGSLEVTNAESYYYANFFTGATYPTAFKMLSTYTANPTYYWTCYDDALEVKSRIQVEIREWNEMDEFALESTGDPDTTGIQTDWLTPINDWPDWDDMLNGADDYPGMPL